MRRSFRKKYIAGREAMCGRRHNRASGGSVKTIRQELKKRGNNGSLLVRVPEQEVRVWGSAIQIKTHAAVVRGVENVVY